MDTIYVGVDVSKDRLDVHVRPSGEAFVVSRDGKGLEELVERLRELLPALVAVEATGGFETIVAAAIAGAALPLAVSARRCSTPKRCCSSMTTRARSRNSTSGCNSA